MLRTVADGRFDTRATPFTFVPVMAIELPAAAGRGAAAHSRKTTWSTYLSGVKTTCSVPVTSPFETVIAAESRGRLGSGWAYDDGQAAAAVVVAARTAAGDSEATAAGDGVADAAGLVADAAGLGAAAAGPLEPPQAATPSARTSGRGRIGRR